MGYKNSRVKQCKSLLLLSFILLISVLLSACTRDLKLPKPEGVQVYFTPSKLTNKLENLKFDLDGDKKLKTTADYHLVRGLNDALTTESGTFSSVIDLSNNDIWTQAKMKIQMDDGIYSGDVYGFESIEESYLDIDIHNNGLFDGKTSHYNQYHNGKYKLIKEARPLTFPTNNLHELHDQMDIVVFSPETFIYGKEYMKFIKTLHLYNFVGLTFYESKSTFMIKLDIKNEDLFCSRDEVKASIINQMYIDLNVLEYFEYHTIIKFKDNQIIELGIHQKLYTEKKVELGTETHQPKATILQTLETKLPESIIYSDYKQIDKLEDIIK